MSKPLSIHLELATDKDVTNDTVKLVATVNASVQPAQRDADLRKEVHTALREIVQADWNIGQITRFADASGLESVALQASLRVPETENYSLDRRARNASRPGLQVTRLIGDTSLPLYMIRAAQRDMRDVLVVEAAKEAERLSTVTGLKMGVRSIVFSTDNPARSNPHKAMNAYAAASTMVGGASEESFGRTEKLFLLAHVIIREVTSS